MNFLDAPSSIRSNIPLIGLAKTVSGKNSVAMISRYVFLMLSHLKIRDKDRIIFYEYKLFSMKHSFIENEIRACLFNC